MLLGVKARARPDGACQGSSSSGFQLVGEMQVESGMMEDGPGGLCGRMWMICDDVVRVMRVMRVVMCEEHVLCVCTEWLAVDSWQLAAVSARAGRSRDAGGDLEGGTYVCAFRTTSKVCCILSEPRQIMVASTSGCQAFLDLASHRFLVEGISEAQSGRRLRADQDPTAHQLPPAPTSCPPNTLPSKLASLKAPPSFLKAPKGPREPFKAPKKPLTPCSLSTKSSVGPGQLLAACSLVWCPQRASHQCYLKQALASS